MLILPGPFPDKPVLSPLEDGLNWQWQREFRYFPRDGTVITIPAGTFTDGTSTPRFLWRIAPPMTGLHRRAAWVHDWLYRMPKNDDTPWITRKYADDIYLEIMERDGVSCAKRTMLYSGVRTFGGSSYQKY